MNETLSVKRLPGSRTIRDPMFTSGRGSFQRLHRTFRRLPANEQDSQIEEELMESDVMDAEGSLHQKTNEVCNMEDAESIGLWSV